LKCTNEALPAAIAEDFYWVIFINHPLVFCEQFEYGFETFIPSLGDRTLLLLYLSRPTPKK
jgi:hypothetical protein